MAKNQLHFYSFNIICGNEPVSPYNITGKQIIELLKEHFAFLPLNTYEHTIGAETYFCSASADIKPADSVPLAFSLYFPPDNNTGILVTQSYGHASITDYVRKQLDIMVKKLNPELRASVVTLDPSHLLKKLLKEEKIKSIKIDLCSDDTYTFSDKFEAHISLSAQHRTVTIKEPAVCDGMAAFIYNIFVHKDKIQYISGITNENDTIENISAEFESRTLSICGFSGTRVTEEIKDKNINTEKVFSVMDKSACIYLEQMGLISYNGLFAEKKLSADHVTIKM